MYFWRSLLAVIWFQVHVCYAVPVSSTSTETIATATPLVIPPSQLWDGNDGPWSSFYLRVGSQPETVRVLISTSSNQPLVVQPGGCSSRDSTCADDRGGVFQSNGSTTWIPRNSSSGGMYAIDLDSRLGLVPGVQYGSDTVALSYLGSGVPALTGQLVGGITTTDLYTGIFGLNPLATNFSNDSPEVASYMSNLKAQNQIPSLSYGYNAGNGYRFNTVFASLTLGGYDNSLFNPNNLTFAFSNESNSDLTVNINSITTKNNSLSLSPFSAFIDTTTPYLWLPKDVCDKFEAAFGITYDNRWGLYLVNDTLHDTLLSKNPNITFTLGNGTSSEVLDIVFPYAAFDLIASSPLVKTPTRYFPLKRAHSTSQVTLGRTFFQEAYLIADYERSTFSVHQMSWDPNAKADITPILPISIYTSSSSTPTPASPKKSTVPKSTIIAATICGAAFLIILAASIILIRRRKNKREVLAKTPPTPATPFTFAHNITPIDCPHCRTHTPTSEPVEAGSGSLTHSPMSSIQSSSIENYNGRDSTPIPAGLAVGPVSPMSPDQTRKDLQNTFPSSQNHQISPSSPGPVIPPRYSSLDRVANPADYPSYEVPRVQSGIYELPAREEVTTEFTGPPVESILHAALDQVIINHNRESQPQQYLPYQPPTSPRPGISARTISQAQAERRLTLHSPVYGEPSSSSQQQPRPHPQIRIQTQLPTTQHRTSLHSPVYGTPRHPENWGTLNQGQQFTFDLHPQLRTARPQNLVQSGRGRDLIREHAQRMREWEAMRGPRAGSPPRRPLPNLPDGTRGVASPVSAGALDPREYSWLRLS